jgi:hypothetical protein
MVEENKKTVEAAVKDAGLFPLSPLALREALARMERAS